VRVLWTSLPYHLYRQPSGPTSYGSSADIPRTFGTTTIESGLSDLTIKRSRLCDSFVARSERCEHVGVTKIGCERSCTYFTQNSTVPCERALATRKDNSEAMPHQHFESQSHVFASPGSNRLPAYASTTLRIRSSRSDNNRGDVQPRRRRSHAVADSYSINDALQLYI
jgi:hypothetical protein